MGFVTEHDFLLSGGWGGNEQGEGDFFFLSPSGLDSTAL